MKDRLVATLGNNSSLKKINRKQILDVDVAKACQTIVDPIAPMALRLQGSLLWVVLQPLRKAMLMREKVRGVACVPATVWICPFRCTAGTESDQVVAAYSGKLWA